MKAENSSREGLIKIILENINSCNFKSKSDRDNAEFMATISQIVGGEAALVEKDPSKILENDLKKGLTPEEVIQNIKNAFLEAGLERQFRQLEFNYSKKGHYHLYECLSYRNNDNTNLNGPSTRNERLSYEERLSHVTELLFDFMMIIEQNIEVDKQYDANRVLEFVTQYLAGLLYNSKLSHASGMNYIVLLYKYYGISLTEEDKKNLIVICKEEINNKEEKIRLSYSEKQIYTPDIINKYIAEDIISKLALKTNKTSTEIHEGPKVETKAEEKSLGKINGDISTLTIDEKIDLIKRKVAELEALSAREKELASALEKTRDEQTRLLEEINSIKL